MNAKIVICLICINTLTYIILKCINALIFHVNTFIGIGANATQVN
jgi:hypothetical protein